MSGAAKGSLCTLGVVAVLGKAFGLILTGVSWGWVVAAILFALIVAFMLTIELWR